MVRRLFGLLSVALAVSLGTTPIATKAIVEGDASLDVVPSYLLKNEVVVVDQLNFTFALADSSKLFTKHLPTGAIGRSYWSLSEAEIASMPPISTNTNGKLVHSRPAGFDIWDAVEQTKAPAGSRMIASFIVRAKESTPVFITLGCTAEARVSLNGRVVYGIAASGFHEFMRAQSVISVELRAGENLVQIEFEKVPGWEEVPELHHENQWMGSIEVYPSAKEAWAMVRSRNFSIVDSPVVESLSNLRVDAALATLGNVALLDINGTEVGSGKLQLDGTVNWMTRLPSYPFVGFIRLGEYADGVVALGESHFKNVESVVEIYRQAIERGGPWGIRVKHLLNPDFVDSRNYWWSRKLALSLVMCCVDQAKSSTLRVLDQYQPASIRFESFVSGIDGTRQYYRICKSRSNGSGDEKVLVVLPCSESQVRKHLESFDVANLIEAEVLASLGKEHGISIVWPGLVDVDCGGLLARKELDECLAAVEQKYTVRGKPRIYLLGTCSSGLLAVGYAETRRIDGLILQSPTTYRATHRWADGLDLDSIEYQSEALASEQTDDKWKRLAVTPIYLVFNTDMPGHGDRAGSELLCEQVKLVGGRVEDHWPEPEHYFTWGERARVQESPMFEWILRNNDSSLNSLNNVVDHARPEIVESIKNSLVQGFTVIPTKDIPLATWLNHWSAVWEGYRGEKWSFGKNDSGRVLVKARLLNQSDFEAIRDKTFIAGRGLVEKSSTDGEVATSDHLFGFRLTQDALTSKKVVEVFRSLSAEDMLPKVDLVLDGCCTAAIWRRVDGQWKLFQLWK